MAVWWEVTKCTVSTYTILRWQASSKRRVGGESSGATETLKQNLSTSTGLWHLIVNNFIPFHIYISLIRTGKTSEKHLTRSIRTVEQDIGEDFVFDSTWYRGLNKWIYNRDVYGNEFSYRSCVRHCTREELVGYFIVLYYWYMSYGIAFLILNDEL